MSEGEGAGSHTVASQLSGYLRAGGIITPLLTALIAFFIGGLVVALTGANPLTTYKAIFEGSGLNWLFPWVTGDDRTLAALNLQQTLIITGPLILTGMAVAYAFRAGLFNIGGQGQYFAGLYLGVIVGSSLDGLPGWLHILLALVLGTLAGALGRDRRLPQGDHRRQRGDLDDHAQLRRALDRGVGVRPRRAAALGRRVGQVGPDLRRGRRGRAPARVLGRPGAPGPAHRDLHRRLALIVFWVLLNRSVAGYEARAVGFSPDAAEYGGIHAGRTYTKVMLICGAFAGLAGVIDILGWQFAVATNDLQNAGVVGAGFIGIAVALLGRNTTSGVLFSALLFGALINGTSVRNLDPEVFPPQLATNLTLIIQGLIVLLVSAPVIVTGLYKLRPRRTRPDEETAAGA